MVRRGLRRLPPFKDYLFRAVVLFSLTFFALALIIVTYRPPAPKNSQSEQAEADQQNIESKTFGQRLLEDPTAFFTMVLAGLTLVLASVSSLQIYFLISADRTTRLAARSAVKSAEVAARTVRSIEDTANIQLRAYVGSKGAGFNTAWINPPFSVTVTIRNFGSTPAINFETAIYLQVLPHPFPGEFPPGNFNFRHGRQSLMPGNESIVVCELRIDDPLISNIVVNAIRQGSMALYIIGRIQYDDVFGMKRFTNMRMLTSGERTSTNAPFIDAPEGNETT